MEPAETSDPVEKQMLLLAAKHTHVAKAPRSQNLPYQLSDANLSHPETAGLQQGLGKVMSQWPQLLGLVQLLE
jgi:hypothetical protein